MYGLTDSEKLDFIIKKSKELGLTSNDYNKHTGLSAMGAHNILTGQSTPRTKSLNMMLQYLESVINNTNNNVKEPIESYSTTNQQELLRIAVEFAENYDKLKNYSIVNNIIEIEVLQRLLKEKESN